MKFPRVFVRFRIASRLAFASLLAISVFPARAGSTSVSELIGARTATTILRTMPSDTPVNQRLDGLHFIAGYETIGKPVPIPADRAASLLAALKNPEGFDSSENEQHMRPGVAYHFEGSSADTAPVDVLVCFSCDKIAVIHPGEDTITVTYHITQATRDALLDLARKLLPQDEAIQELPRVRSEHPVPPPPAPIPKDAPRPGQSSPPADS